MNVYVNITDLQYDQLPTFGLIAQLVECCTGVAARGHGFKFHSSLFRLSFHNCLSCVHNSASLIILFSKDVKKCTVCLQQPNLTTLIAKDITLSYLRIQYQDSTFPGADLMADITGVSATILTASVLIRMEERSVTHASIAVMECLSAQKRVKVCEHNTCI